MTDNNLKKRMAFSAIELSIGFVIVGVVVSVFIFGNGIISRATCFSSALSNKSFDPATPDTTSYDAKINAYNYCVNPVIPIGGAGYPNSIAGLKIWVDAQDASKVFNVSGNPASFEQDVSSWRDKSGNNNHMSASGLPTYKSNMIGNKPALYFSSDSMSSSYVLDPNSEFTVIIVFKFREFPEPFSTTRYYFWSWNNTSNFSALYAIPGDHWTGDRRLYLPSSSGANAISGYKLNVGGNYIIATRYKKSPNNILVKLTASGSATTEVINSSYTSPLVSGSGFSIALSAESGNYYSNFNYGEVLVYNRALTDEEFDNIISHLKLVWGF